MKKIFSISPRVFSHFGEDQLKNDSLALLELVKNSYDACATKCVVEFITDKKQRLKELIIEDDGFGMNKSIIENAWLTVGTDYKLKRIKPNVCERVPLGEKGIGRLGVHKLGHNFTLISKKSKSKEISMFIDWTNLEHAEEIEDFEIDLYELDTPSHFKTNTGTRIVIKDLKSSWDKRQLREVHRSLNSLNSPFGESNDQFNVEIKIDYKGRVDGAPNDYTFIVEYKAK